VSLSPEWSHFPFQFFFRDSLDHSESFEVTRLPVHPKGCFSKIARNLFFFVGGTCEINSRTSVKQGRRRVPPSLLQFFHALKVEQLRKLITGSSRTSLRHFPHKYLFRGARRWRNFFPSSSWKCRTLSVTSGGSRYFLLLAPFSMRCLIIIKPPHGASPDITR